MTSKFSFGLAANDRPEQSSSERDDEDGSAELASDQGTEIMVDASEDVTVEAQEDVTTEASALETQGEVEVEPDGGASMATPPPLSAESADTRAATETLLGMLSPAVPLPGVTAPSGSEDSAEEPISLGPEIASEDEDDDEITVMARPLDRLVNMDAPTDDLQALGDRPSITDDEEEETKVEPAETAARAAASRDDEDDDLSAALSEQASHEREKALRKSATFAPLSSSSNVDSDDLEFADPDDDEAVGATDLLEEGEDDESAGTFPKAAEPSSLAAAFTARRLGSPPLGTPFGTRLPTPSPGFGGLSLASPVQVPAPTSSPFGRLPAPGAAPGARMPGMGGALQIPAPSGSAAAAPPAGPSAIFRKVSIPVVGLLASGAAVLGLGFLFGYQVSGNRAPVVVAAPATAPGPVVQPVKTSPAPGTPADTASVPAAEKSAAADTAPVPLPAAPAAKPTTEPIVAESPAAAPRPAKRVVTRTKKAADEDEEESAASKPVAKSTPSKPKSVKPSKGWVDPFAD